MAAKSAKGGDAAQEFLTIDPLFFLNKSQLEAPESADPTHLYNGKPTDFTDLQSENMTLDPHRAAMLRRSNFLPYDGVLYEINDAPGEEDAHWSHNGRHGLTYNEYQRMLREEKRIALQSIVVKQHEAKSIDYSRSPHRPLQDFFKALVDPHSPKRLRLLIPPTLVHTESLRAVYFTDPATGYLRRLKGEEIDESVLRQLFLDGKSASEKAAKGSEPDLPMGVLKRMSGGKNDIALQNLSQVLLALRSQVEGAYVLQKFVKPRGMHAAVYRTTWRRNGAPATALVSNMKSMRVSPAQSNARLHFCTNSTDLDSNTVLSFRGRGATETQEICAEIVDFVEKRKDAGCKFDVFVGDFLKDEKERWYLLQAKNFVCSSARS